jgi:hypothetical protein
MKNAFSSVLPAKPVVPLLILAALEIEAWFIADYSHFPRINRTLTPRNVKRALGIDIINQSVESIAEPATLLNDIYALRGLSYTKSAADATRTVAALDLNFLLDELPTLAPNFAPLRAELVEFFTPPWRKLTRRLTGGLTRRIAHVCGRQEP